MPVTKRAMPEAFHMTTDIFRRGTTPGKSELLGSCNRPLISPSTGSGVRTWIRNRRKPTTVNQTQRGTELFYELPIWVSTEVEKNRPICSPARPHRLAWCA
jgi:hypothetical protein